MTKNKAKYGNVNNIFSKEFGLSF